MHKLVLNNPRTTVWSQKTPGLLFLCEAHFPCKAQTTELSAKSLKLVMIC